MYSAKSTYCLLPMLLTSSLFLAACSGSDKTDVSASTAAASSSEVTSAATPAADTTALDAALNPKEVKFTLSLVGKPIYIADKDVLRFEIQVDNQGRTTLVGAGSKPVNLAALLLGPDGPDKAPGLREFVRVHLPVIAPGEKKTVEADLPGESLKGQTVQFQLVQEGVAWFGGAGQNELTLGDYSRCSNAEKALCDATGSPVSGK